MLLSLSYGFLAQAQYTRGDWKERDTWMNVQGILEAMGVQEGQTVADLGCHEGYMTLHLANAVGDQGKVYAVDVNTYRLQQLRRHMKRNRINQVETIYGDYDNPKLPENSLDAIIIMDAYHEMTDYMTILGHVKKALKPGGRLVMIEEIDGFRKEDSRSSQTQNHDLGINYASQELKAAGFAIESQNEDFGRWENKKNKTIWLLVATRPQL